MDEMYPSIGEIIDGLLDESTIDNLEFKFFLEVLAGKITRRQAIILRLIMMGVTSQVDIAKMLGYSFVTISVDIKKLRVVVKKMLKEETNSNFRCPEIVKKKLIG